MDALRDIVIVVFGIGGLAATVVVLVMALTLYRKVSTILDSANSMVDSATATMNGVEAFSRGVLNPLSQSSGVLSALSKIISWLLRDDRKSEPADNE